MTNKNISIHPTVSSLQKVTLVLFGILLTVVLLETGLRAAEFILRSLQEYKNLLSIQQHGEYRIMCIGESTTAGQYLPFLEKALNQRNIGIKFSVIDKGIGATNTSFILAYLEKNIERYHPNLVVAMIGINEGATHMLAGFNSGSRTFFSSPKVYKLAKLLFLHMQNKIKEIKAGRKDDTVLMPSEKNGRPAQPSVTYKQNTPRTIESENVTDGGIKDDNFFNELGKQLTAQEDFSSARQAFRRAIEYNAYNVDAYFRLAALSDQNICYSLMREIFEKYRSLIKTGTPDDVQKANINHLCKIMLGKGMYLEVEELCKGMLAKNLMCSNAYIILAMNSIAQNQYAVAGNFFKKAIELDNSDNRAFDGLAVVYHETGRYDLSEQYLRKANELRPFYPTMLVIRNYKKIKDILDTRNIKLVCVQYPMRSVEPLKEIFEGEKNIIFVDNEQVFKRAIKKGFYKDFFRDMWVGDFGHCTNKGNELLAQNIADVILKEVFGK